MFCDEKTQKRRKEWLAALKEGDEVAVETKMLGFQDTYVIRKVVKITPKRSRFDVDSPYGAEKIESYDKDGERRVGGTWGNTFRIHEVTDEIQEEIKRYKAISYIERQVEKQSVRKFSTDVLMKLADTISTELRRLHDEKGAASSEDDDE